MAIDSEVRSHDSLITDIYLVDRFQCFAASCTIISVIESAFEESEGETHNYGIQLKAHPSTCGLIIAPSHAMGGVQASAGLREVFHVYDPPCSKHRSRYCDENSLADLKNAR